MRVSKPVFLPPRPRGARPAICRFAELPEAAAVNAYLERQAAVKDMNFKWREQLAPEQVEVLDEVMGPTLVALGYAV